MQRPNIWRLAIMLTVLSTANVARAQTPAYQKIHEGKHWTWFARQDQFGRHKADIAALCDYADKAFDKLCDAWGLKPPKFGWAMFRKAFRTAIDDGIRWDAFGANPSKLRTAYVAAYLQIGAPEDIGGILGPLVPEYDAQAVKDIVRARSMWSALPPESSRRKALKAAFLRGDYLAALK